MFRIENIYERVFLESEYPDTGSGHSFDIVFFSISKNWPYTIYKLVIYNQFVDIKRLE